MSLAVDVDKVTMVLLNDGWHRVVNESFTIDAYEYRQSDEGVVPAPSIGATWLGSDETRIYCSLAAVLAVRTGEATDQRKR
jgi:hypothetical protein